MQNTQRTIYMAIERNIISSKNISQLRAMREPTFDYYNKNIENDGKDLLQVYMEQEDTLSVEKFEDKIGKN